MTIKETHICNHDHEEEYKLQNQDKIEIGTNARILDFTPNNKKTRDSIN